MAIEKISWDPNDTGVPATYCQVITGMFVAKTQSVMFVVGGWIDATHATEKKNPLVQKQFNVKFSDVNPAALEANAEALLLAGDLKGGSHIDNVY